MDSASCSNNQKVEHPINDQSETNETEEKEEMEISDVEKEVIATEEVINAMLYYRKYAARKFGFSYVCLSKLPREHQMFLKPFYDETLLKLKRCVAENQRVFHEIVASGAAMFEDDQPVKEAFKRTQLRPASEHYMLKVKSTLKQIMRDWSVEGKFERRCYEDIKSTLAEIFPERERADVTILIPGAGLARLAWELIVTGFTVQGNEFSMLMLLTSNFILNRCKEVNEYVIYPYIMEMSNTWSNEDRMRPVLFPDVCPAFDITRLNKFSMSAGDFLLVSKEEDYWDVVVTVFFIDTAANIFEYVDRIHKILRRGGMWINFGPLTYHFADDETKEAIELPYDVVLDYIEKKGFMITRDERGGDSNITTYAANHRSMLNYQYTCGLFHCFKQEPKQIE